MKKIFLGALLTVLVAGSAFAADVNEINSAVLYSFKSEFKKAADVNWTTTADYSKATFTIDNQQMEAFYSRAGEIIATTQNIGLEALPVEAKRTFAKKFNGYNVKEAIHFHGVEEEAYYIAAENEKESVIVKVSPDQSLSIFKKVKK